ncbi:MAG: Serine/threonine-protein kinase PknD [Phycisphaerae bacterium]|nr:Serine/threonine-protein kinase PknD [Phycisphaerae bacterium]
MKGGSDVERFRRERIEQLVQDALDIDTADRAAFLDRACGGDAGVRAEVERLLAVPDRKLETFLDVPPISRMLSAGADDAAADRLPLRVGRYSVVRKVGEGGMGIVYEAMQEAPRRRVALKVIRPGLIGRSLLRRFRHEAEALAHLNHPGIAHVYETGVGEVSWPGVDGAAAASEQQPFLAMEFVEGEPITQYAARRNLRTVERLSLVARLCDAIHHAHLKGVIHRDLKPGNILVTGPEPDHIDAVAAPSAGGRVPPVQPRPVTEPQPKILDFGVARLVGDDATAVTLQTGQGQVIGTIPYMSPEQITGDTRNIDARTDVYALGVLLYELLAGKLPFELDGRPLAEAARIVREEDPSRLSTFDAGYRGDVETIVGKAIEKDKERRYASAAELAADIRRFLRDEPLMARPASALYQLRKYARRHRALVGGVAATAVTLIVGIVLSSYFAVTATRQRMLADRSAEAATRLAYRSGLSAAQAAIESHDGALARRALDETPSELRGWEWAYLNYRLTRGERVLTPGAGKIVCADALLDGSALVCGTTEGDVAVVRTDDGRILRRLASCGEPIDQVVLNADDTRLALAIGGPAGRVEMRRFPQGELLWRAEHRGQISRWAFHPDGRRVVVGTWADRVEALDVETGARVQTYQLRRALDTFVGYNRDGTIVLAGLDHGFGAGLDAATGRELWTGEMSRFDYGQPPGLLAASVPGRASILEPSTGRRLISLPRSAGLILDISMNHEGTLAAVLEETGNAYLYDVETGEPVTPLLVHPPTEPVRFFRRGGGIYALDGGLLRIWDDVNGPAPFLISAIHGPNFHAVFRGDGRRAYCGAWGAIKAWDPGTGAEVWTSLMGRPDVRRLDLDDAEALLAAALSDRRVVVVSAESGRGLAQSAPLESEVIGLMWTAASTQVLVLDAGGTLHFLDGRTLSSVQTRDTVTHATTLAGEAGRRRLAVGDGAGRIVLWNIDPWREVGRIVASSEPVTAAAFSQEAGLLASGDAAGEVRLHVLGQIGSGPTARLSTGSRVQSLAFSPDGRRVAAGTVDATVRVIDTTTGVEWLTLRDGIGVCTGLAFTVEGSALLSVHSSSIEVYESRSMRLDAGARNQVRRVRAHVDAAFERHGLCDDVVAALATDPALSEHEQALAVRIAQARGNNTGWQNSEAWGIVLYADRSAEEYAFARRLIEPICAAFPEEPAYLNTRGVAEFRLGEFEKARETFERCLALTRERGQPPQVADQIFLAMALHRLGRVDEAASLWRVAQERATNLMSNKEIQNFVREAERLVSNPGLERRN